MSKNYTPHGLKISDNQKEKRKLAIKNNEAVTIRIEDIGDDILALTTTQINKINKAFEKDKGVNIKLSKQQLKYNKDHVTGGFIGLLARSALPMAAKVLPQVGKHLALGSLAGVATNLVNKVLGKGLYLKRGGCVCQIKDDRGEGLYLKPMRTNELDKYGDGFYLKNDNGIIDGSGLIGEITKDIPLLNILF